MGIELLPIVMPAVVIVAVAVRLVRRATSSADSVLDLRDDAPAPVVGRSAMTSHRAPSPGPPTGALVEPALGGTLGARIRSVDALDPTPHIETTPDEAGASQPVRGRVVIGRRRARPLVAQR